MNIFGIGSDIVPVDRFRRIETQSKTILLERLFTPREASALSRIGSAKFRHKAYAASFCIKEAIFKALGTGLIKGMSWRDVEVEDVLHGCYLNTFGRTSELFSERKISSWQLSCSATNEIAIASATLFTKDT